MQLNNRVAEKTFDNLINSPYPSADVFGVVIATGQGELKRGTALAKKDDGKMVILGTEGAVANCILADDIDATNEAQAVAYRTGHFNQDVLIVKEGYELTSEDKEAFRIGGILLDPAYDLGTY